MWVFASWALAVRDVPLDPLPLPAGWGWVGPLVPERAEGRDLVVIDPTSCEPRIAAIDLDAGPYARDARIARVWTGAAWSWADDWRVEGETLLRPGRAPVPSADVPEQLDTDAAGRVTARHHDGRTLRILRGAEGQFRGMAVGRARVELMDEEGVPAAAAQSGSSRVEYRWEGGQLTGVSRGGRSTRYGWEEDRLRSLLWDDGNLLRVEADGTSGFGGRWRCERGRNRSTVRGPDGGAWSFDWDERGLRATDPQGTRMAVALEAGRLGGWTDPSGHRVTLVRDEAGRAASIKLDGSESARVQWTDGELSSLSLGSARWTLRRTEAGLVGRLGPDGRSVTRELGEEGAPLAFARGGVSLTVGRDADGRVRSVRLGTQGEARMERDAAGSVVRIQDPSGGEWRLGRDESGALRTVTDPAGGEWRLQLDALGRFAGLATPSGRRLAVVRQGDTVVQIGAADGPRWTLLRDAVGALSGVRDPVGRTWGYARDAAGRLSQLRRPDGTAVSVKLDEAGRPEAVGPARVRRDGAARAVELSAPGWGGVRWTRDAAGRVTAVEAGAVHFEAAYDAGGHLVTASLGESPLSVQWDSAGNVSGAGPLPAEAGVQTRIERNGAGRITALIRGDLALRLARDLRGRVDAVTEGDRKWEVGRDPLGRIARLEGPDGLSVGANWEPDGGLSMIRLDGGTIVRRNVSADAGEILAVNGAGDPIGHAGWTLDDSGLVETVVLGRKLHIQRDASGVPTAVEVDGPPVPGSEVWSRTPSEVGGWDGLHADLDPDGGLKRLRVAADADRAWGLEAGEATARRDGAGRLTGLDGSAGGATLVHDDLGRLVSYAVGERSVRLARDAFGRLVDVGATSTAGWDGLLRWGAQIRAPIAAEAVARPGGAVLCDPRGFPFFVPWVGGLRTWPTGFVPGIEAAETGPRGRVALDAGGPLISLTDAVDPLTGQRTSGPPLLPWTARRVEPPEALSPWASPDAASPAEWDAAGWDRSGWTDALARLLDRGMLAHAGPEAPSTPGLPWLPASFGAEVPAPVAGVGGLILDEDPATAVVLGWALSGSPPDAAAMVRALAGDRLASEARVAPGLDPPLPPTLRAPLASEPFGH